MFLKNFKNLKKILKKTFEKIGWKKSFPKKFKKFS